MTGTPQLANNKPATVEMTIDQFIKKYNTTFKAPERFGNWLKPTGGKRALTKINFRLISSSLSGPVFGNHQYFTHSVQVQYLQRVCSVCIKVTIPV